jgi:hypothetical protein
MAFRNQVLAAVLLGFTAAPLWAQPFVEGQHFAPVVTTRASAPSVTFVFSFESESAARIAPILEALARDIEGSVPVRWLLATQQEGVPGSAQMGLARAMAVAELYHVGDAFRVRTFEHFRDHRSGVPPLDSEIIRGLATDAGVQEDTYDQAIRNPSLQRQISGNRAELDQLSRLRVLPGGEMAFILVNGRHRVELGALDVDGLGETLPALIRHLLTL